jgi:multidrug efflux system membrane fusion protein
MTQVTGIDPEDVLANSSFEKLQDNAKVVVPPNPAPANKAGSSSP